jgi:hypothetical protein
MINRAKVIEDGLALGLKPKRGKYILLIKLYIFTSPEQFNIFFHDTVTLDVLNKAKKQ